MKTKHTPGPYSYQYWPELKTWIISEGYTNDVASVKGASHAHLMAAAPECLSALKDLYEWAKRYAPPESNFYELTAARAAIAKAEGRD